MTDRTDRTSCGTTTMPAASAARWAPPLDIAVDQARSTLDHIHHTSETTGLNGTVWNLHGTSLVLRLLTDATRAHGQRSAALDHAEQILTHIDRAGYTVELRDAGHLLADTVTTMAALLDQAAPAPGEPEQPKIPNPRPPSPWSATPDGTGWEHHPATAVAA